MSVLGLFIKPMAAETGLSRTELSLAPSLMALVAAACSPFVGYLVDRWGARTGVLIGVLMLPLGLLGHAMLGPSLPQFMGLALLMGVAASVACPLPYVSALPQWFQRNLGLAIALSMSGIGFGEIVLPKLSAYLIGSGGWRHAWAVLAAVILLVGLCNVIFLFEDNPQFRARKALATAKSVAVPLPGLSWRQAVRTPTFWLLGAAVCLVAQVAVGMMIHVVPMLTDRGMTADSAANAIAILGVGSLIGRLATGFALDHLSISLVGGVLFLLQAIGMLALWTEARGLVPYFSVFFVGLAVGAETDIIPFAVRAKFGVRDFGKIFGLTYALFSLGPVLGPLLMGWAFDSLGSYSLILLIFAAAGLAAAIAIAIAGRLRAFDDNLEAVA